MVRRHGVEVRDRTAAGTQRSAALDALRALAVVLVLGRHVYVYRLPDAAGHPWLRAAVETWRRGGWVGVDLFFVLSGFLVSGLPFRERERHAPAGRSRRPPPAGSQKAGPAEKAISPWP